MSALKRVRLALGKRSYDIWVGPGAIQKAPLRSKSKRAFILGDERLSSARARLLSVLEGAGWEAHDMPVPAGEGLKDIQSVYPLYGELLKRKANRDSTIFALGGGSIGDVAGFVASTYLRGLPWVSVPTTLLSQVDSGIGGKTGINHAMGKNLIGTFHQPALVVCDTDFLKTLDRREILSGLGEVVKYGLAFDPLFYSSLEKRIPRLIALDQSVLASAIQRSVAWKCKAVARDEFDRKGAREVLNFGHTFGHALESVAGYGTYQHGEAVIWGMRFAVALSRVRRKLNQNVYAQVSKFLSSLDVPPLPGTFDSSELLAAMERDKKVRNGKIHFVLLRKIGQTVSDSNVSPAEIGLAWSLLQESVA